MKRLIKTAKAYLPIFFQQKVDKLVLDRKLSRCKERRLRVQVPIEDVRAVLERFDFNSDVLIHSSISNIGRIRGGAPAVVATITELMDLNERTLLAPALPFMGYVQDYLDSLDNFSVCSAKNCMGDISNLLMRRDDCVRSLHPSHSVIAVGKKSREYIGEHHLSKTPFDEHSPYSKLSLFNGQILMFGVGLNSVTSNHVYEDMLGSLLPFNVYSEELYEIPCIGVSEEDYHTVSTRAHNPAYSAKRNAELARCYLEKSGAIKTFSLGDSEVSMLNARKLNQVLLEMLLDGKSIYGKVRLNKLQRDKVTQLISEFEEEPHEANLNA